MPRLADVVRAFGVEPDAIRLIGHRTNTHWAVRAGARRLVLRRFGETPLLVQSAAWELSLIEALAERGWPVPRPLAPPREIGGRLWLLMPHLAGCPLARARADDAGYRRLGRELASLHNDLATLPPPPQRPGWGSFVDAAMPLNGGLPWRSRLMADLAAVAPYSAPRFELALAALEARDLPRIFAGAPLAPIHGDFSPWNLLYRRGALSGILDFELAHIDVLAADLAFARRGSHDAVVEGYLTVRPMRSEQLAALDGLWLGSLFYSLWLILEGWRRAGRPEPAQLDWHIEQLSKTRPYR